MWFSRKLDSVPKAPFSGKGAPKRGFRHAPFAGFGDLGEVVFNQLVVFSQQDK
jgi:hypothetical protein